MFESWSQALQQWSTRGAPLRRKIALWYGASSQRSLFAEGKLLMERLRATRFGRSFARTMLAFDGWIDSSLYESGQNARGRYEAFAMFMD